MIKNVKLKYILLSLGFSFVAFSNISNSYAKIDITKSFSNDTSAEFTISSDSNSDYIVLPGGNKIKKNSFKYITSSNGTYTFAEKSFNGDIKENSISVSDLRAGLLVTGNPNVSLELSSTDTLSGLNEMRFKNEADGQWSEFEPYATTKNWILKRESGERSVYAQYKDVAGNISEEVHDRIYLDLNGPTSTLFKINNGELYTNNENVQLTINAVDDYSEVDIMKISNNNTNFQEFKYATSLGWTLPSEEGLHTVYLRLVDSSGNEGITELPSINTASITLDKTKPSGTIDIIEATIDENGQFTVPSSKVTLNITTFDALSGVKEINLYEGGKKTTLPKVPPNNVSQTVDWTLSTNSPTTKITLEVIDNAGNIYRTDSITVTVSSFKVVDFYLDNIFNPAVFKGQFNRLSWYGSKEENPRPSGFPRQPMASGGDIDFSLEYDVGNKQPSEYDMEWKYIITINEPGSDTPKVYESEKTRVSIEEKENNLIKGKYKIPYDAKKGSIVSIQIEVDLLSNGDASQQVISQSAIFPIEGGKAQIGEILGDIREDIKFNEIE